MGESMSVEQEWLAELDGEDLRREPSGNPQEHLEAAAARQWQVRPRVERRGKARYAPG